MSTTDKRSTQGSWSKGLISLHETGSVTATLFGMMVARMAQPQPPAFRPAPSAARLLRDYGGGLSASAFKVIVMRSRAAQMAADEHERQDYRTRLDDYLRRKARRAAELAEYMARDRNAAESIQAQSDANAHLDALLK